MTGTDEFRPPQRCELRLYSSSQKALWGYVPSKLKDSINFSNIQSIVEDTSINKDNREFCIVIVDSSFINSIVFGGGPKLTEQKVTTITFRAKTVNERMVWMQWLQVAINSCKGGTL